MYLSTYAPRIGSRARDTFTGELSLSFTIIRKGEWLKCARTLDRCRSINWIMSLELHIRYAHMMGDNCRFRSESDNTTLTLLAAVHFLSKDFKKRRELPTELALMCSHPDLDRGEESTSNQIFSVSILEVYFMQTCLMKNCHRCSLPSTRTIYQTSRRSIELTGRFFSLIWTFGRITRVVAKEIIAGVWGIILLMEYGAERLPHRFRRLN